MSKRKRSRRNPKQTRKEASRQFLLKEERGLDRTYNEKGPIDTSDSGIESPETSKVKKKSFSLRIKDNIIIIGAAVPIIILIWGVGKVYFDAVHRLDDVEREVSSIIELIDSQREKYDSEANDFQKEVRDDLTRIRERLSGIEAILK